MLISLPATDQFVVVVFFLSFGRFHDCHFWYAQYVPSVIHWSVNLQNVQSHSCRFHMMSRQPYNEGTATILAHQANRLGIELFFLCTYFLVFHYTNTAAGNGVKGLSHSNIGQFSEWNQRLYKPTHLCVKVNKCQDLWRHARTCPINFLEILFLKFKIAIKPWSSNASGKYNHE